MAWQAKLNKPVTKDQGGLTIQAEFVYYDDVDPLTTLHSRMFSFKPGLTNAQMRLEVENEGRAARAAHTRAVNVAVAFPVGTTIAVP